MEALNMLYTEFNMEDALEVRYEEGEAIRIIAGCDQSLVDQVRKERSQEADTAS